MLLIDMFLITKRVMLQHAFNRVACLNADHFACSSKSGKKLNKMEQNKTLEQATDHYVISIMIGLFACFAHQNFSFWWEK